ncbi:MAG: N-acetyltransferase [Melioribacteraceae bacterium]|nr:MAG: N-acetyltransferase [Melioribacteraceae bacterium]
MIDIFEVPELTTNRLVLRPFTLADVPDIVNLMKDKEISDNTMFIPYPYSENDAIDWLATHSTELGENKGLVFAITLKESKTFVGSIGLTFNADNNHTEMGYWIGKNFWNNGYATEASKRVMEFAFDDICFNRVHAHFMSSNPQSGRVMEKIGMKYEGTMRQHLLKFDKYQDIIIYGITKEDYNKLNQNER